MPVFTELTVQLGLGDNDEKGDDLHRERGELQTGWACGGALEPGVEERLGLRVFIARSGNPC